MTYRGSYDTDSYGNYLAYAAAASDRSAAYAGTSERTVAPRQIQIQNSRESWMGGRYTGHDTSSESPGGSQAALLSTKVRQEKWKHAADFLAASLAFCLSLHSIWSLPIAILQNGGVTFLLMYFAMLILLGGPVIILEMFLGQYSGLAPVRLFRHLCPILSGLGLTICVQACMRMFLELGVLTWAGQSLFLVFSREQITDGFFYKEVLNKDSSSSLEQLGEISGQTCLVLGIASILTFVLVAAGSRSIGKVSMVLIPLMFMLLVSLTIRACIAPGGMQGVATLLAPDWRVMTSPTAWLEATSQVAFSLQLGIGAIMSYASFNKFQQNIVRDTIIVLISHLVWVLLGVLLVLALLGLAHNSQTINIGNLASDPALVSITGKGIWLIGITVLESALSQISYGWLWAGLFFVFLCLVCISSILGYVEVITGSIVNIKPGLISYRPLITFCVLIAFFLLDIFMAAQGGIHVYHLLATYISQWPQLLITLLTVLPAVLCHGTRNIMKDLSDMSRVCLHHFISSHLSTLYYTVIPILITAALCWSLRSLAIEHLIDPLATFSMSLPASWGVPLGLSLAVLPVAPIIIGGIVHLLFGARGVPRTTHIKRSLKPTDRYYRNEHLEIQAEATNKYTTANRDVSVV